MDTPTTSSTLLELLQRTPLDHGAWEAFFGRYHPWMLQRCLRLRLQDADAEEVTGRVLQKLVRVFQDFQHDPRKRFRGYLSTVIVNEFRSYLRELGRCPGALGMGASDQETWLASVAVQEISRDLDSRVLADLELAGLLIRQVRGKVQEKTWQAYARTTLEGRPSLDVAGELGMSLSSVYVARNRIRKMLERAAADLTGSLEAAFRTSRSGAEPSREGLV